MINIQYKKTIDEEVKPVVTFTMVNALEIGDRYGSLTIQYVNNDGVELDREEINYSKGEEFERFYADWTDTQYLADTLNQELEIEIPKVEDPVIEVTIEEPTVEEKPVLE